MSAPIGDNDTNKPQHHKPEPPPPTTNGPSFKETMDSTTGSKNPTAPTNETTTQGGQIKFGSMTFSPKQYAEFKAHLLTMISTQIQQDLKAAKKAAQKMKESFKGQ
tara:strand:+ start:27 stop:344 length:318 start_codon:yes stop_codon:yes gene_type:complete